MTNWREKNVGVLLKKGTSRERVVVNEDTGRRAGKHIDHWDDRTDAVVEAPTLKVKLGMKEEVR